jgi:hypothetical protein
VPGRTRWLDTCPDAMSTDVGVQAWTTSAESHRCSHSPLPTPLPSPCRAGETSPDRRRALHRAWRGYRSECCLSRRQKPRGRRGESGDRETDQHSHRASHAWARVARGTEVGAGALSEVLPTRVSAPTHWSYPRSPQPWTRHHSAASWSRAILTVASSVATSARRMSE